MKGISDHVPRTCHQCGKKFYLGIVEDWIYKKPLTKETYIWFCSWHCYNAYFKEKEKKREKPMRE